MRKPPSLRPALLAVLPDSTAEPRHGTAKCYLVRLQGLPPTGKSFAMAEIAIFRMEGSKIV